MQYRKLGRSGCAVSALALGTMTFGDTTDESEAFAQLDAFVDTGGTLIDTADVYADGLSERIIGRWIAKRGNGATEALVVATKGRFQKHVSEPNSIGLSRRHLDRALSSSLTRLGLDTIDLYQLHGWDPLTPLDETLGFLDDAMAAGKIRYVGLSNFTGWQIQRAVDLAENAHLAGPVTLQAQYNLLTRESEWELLPACEYNGLGVLTWSPLAGGLLAGRYSGESGASDPAPANGRVRFWFGSKASDQRTGLILQSLQAIASAHACSLSQVALAWLSGRATVSSVILGCRTLDQLKENLGSVQLELAPEEVETLDRVSLPPIDYPYGGPALAQRSRNIDGTSFTHARP